MKLSQVLLYQVNFLAVEAFIIVTFGDYWRIRCGYVHWRMLLTSSGCVLNVWPSLIMRMLQNNNKSVNIPFERFWKVFNLHWLKLYMRGLLPCRGAAFLLRCDLLCSTCWYMCYFPYFHLNACHYIVFDLVLNVGYRQKMQLWSMNLLLRLF